VLGHNAFVSLRDGADEQLAATAHNPLRESDLGILAARRVFKAGWSAAVDRSRNVRGEDCQDGVSCSGQAETQAPFPSAAPGAPDSKRSASGPL